MTASVIAILGLVPLTTHIGGYTIGIADVAVAGLLIYFCALHMTFAVNFKLCRQGRLSLGQE
jgi:hypothetical protein